MPLTIVLDDIGVGTLQQAAIGSVVGVVSNQALSLGWVIGQKGRASHVVMADKQGSPMAQLLDDFVFTHALHVVPRASLVLTVSSNEADPNAIRHPLGWLGLTQHGPVVCAGELRNGFHLVPLYIDLRSGEIHRETTPVDASWLATWSLSVKGVDDELTRIIGSPDWSQVTGDHR